MQRFRAALVTGNYPDNPEDLLRDSKGQYVLYVDAVRELMDWKKLALAKLGVKRDIMTQEEINIVQKFLGV